MPFKLFIHGSCVSTDCISKDNPRVSLVDYFARTSIASQFSESPALNLNLNALASKFQQRMVLRDVEKHLKSALTETDYDILLIDLIDERFDLQCFDASGVITRSSESLVTQRDTPLPPFRLVKSGSDEFLKLWTNAWYRLLSTLAAAGQLSKLVLHKTLWDTRFTQAENPPAAYSTSVIAHANTTLERLYEIAAMTIPAGNIIDMTDSVEYSDENQWGPAPFHFSRAYYERLESRLCETQARLAQQATLRNTRPSVSNWDNHRIHTFKELMAAEHLDDGAYLIQDDSGHISFQLQLPTGSSDAGAKRQLLCVGFGGAVTDRDKKTGPFYSGTSIASGLGGHLCFADPTVSRYSDIGLAWYAGDRLNSHTQVKIASIIEFLCRKHDLYPVLFGGSGGGFSALAISHLLEQRHAVVVWNPQTSIALYSAKNVTEFLDKSDTANTEPIGSADARISRIGAITDLAKIDHSNCDRIIYLQNVTDWHTEVHASRLVPTTSPNEWHANVFELLNARGFLWLGNWGTGHVPPSKDLIRQALSLAAGPQSDTEVATILNHCFSEQVPTVPRMPPAVSVGELMIGYEANPGRLTVLIDNIPSFHTAAIYLTKGRKAVEKSWYAHQPVREFLNSEISLASLHDFSLDIFLKDCWGKRATRTVRLSLEN